MKILDALSISGMNKMAQVGIPAAQQDVLDQMLPWMYRAPVQTGPMPGARNAFADAIANSENVNTPNFPNAPLSHGNYGAVMNPALFAKGSPEQAGAMAANTGTYDFSGTPDVINASVPDYTPYTWPYNQ